MLRTCILLCLALSAYAQDPTEQLAREAQSAFAARDYGKAARFYERLLQFRPDWPEVLNNLGVTYHLLGETAKAVATLEQALRLNPDLPRANLILGMDYIRLGNPERAVPRLTKALERDPANRDALLALASAYYGMRDFVSAVEVYLRETKLNPKDADGWYGMGFCLEAAAENGARLLSKLGPGSTYRERLVGDYLLEQDSAIDAEQAFRRALKSASPAGAEGLHARLALAHLRLGEMNQAAQDAGAERRLYPANPDGKFATAAIAAQKKNFDESLRSLCDLHSAERGYFLTRLGSFSSYVSEDTRTQFLAHLRQVTLPPGCSPLGPLLTAEMDSPQTAPEFAGVFEPRKTHSAAAASRSGHFLEAFRAANAAAKAAPSSMAAIYWQAETARKLAKAAFQNAVRLNPDSWQGHLLLGDIYRQRNEWEQSSAHYMAAAKLQPSSPAPHLGLATVHWQNARFEEAEAALKKVLEMDPQNTQANFELGDIYVRLHRFEEAIPHLRTALDRNPDLLVAHADLGKAYASLDNPYLAETELVQSLPMDRFGNLHYQLYMVYKKLGKTALAANALVRSKELKASELQQHQQRQERYLGAAAEP